MKKTNITKARRLFNEGVTIYLMPSKVAFANPWISPIRINNVENENTFDSIVNAYRYYNLGNGYLGGVAYWYDDGRNQ